MRDRELTIVSRGATEPVSLAEARIHLDLATTNTTTITDATLGQYISAARQTVESWTKYRLVQTTIDLRQTDFNGDSILLPGVPLISVTSIKTVDTDNSETTFADTSYYVSTPGNKHGYATLNYGYTWPTALRDRNNVLVRYVCGYTNADAANKPDPVFQEAIKQIVRLNYQFPAGIPSGPDSEYLFILQSLLIKSRPY